MFCPKCGTENPEGANLCSSCGCVLTGVIPAAEAKTSALAVTSLVLSILCFLILRIATLLTLILGIISLIRITKSKGQLKGKGIAITGIAISFVSICLFICILIPSLIRAHTAGKRVSCIKNMVALSTAMNLYADNNKEEYPTSDKWCDLLEKYLANDKLYVCPSAKQGKCNYAINKNLPKLRQQIKNPYKTVLLFESKPGWNQSGGPELLTTENHHGEQYNVAFCDGHVEVVRIEDINILRWTAVP